jgi:hypothetical protein
MAAKPKTGVFPHPDGPLGPLGGMAGFVMRNLSEKI